MASHQDDPEAGPSGLTVEEMLALLGLDTSEAIVEEDEEEPSLTCEEVLGESDEDDLCHEALERFERQRAFQTQLLQQSGGGLDSSVGTFDFETTNLWIARVLAWASANVISISVYVKRGTLSLATMSSRHLKTAYAAPWIAC